MPVTEAIGSQSGPKSMSSPTLNIPPLADGIDLDQPARKRPRSSDALVPTDTSDSQLALLVPPPAPITLGPPMPSVVAAVADANPHCSPQPEPAEHSLSPLSPIQSPRDHDYHNNHHHPNNNNSRDGMDLASGPVASAAFYTITASEHLGSGNGIGFNTTDTMDVLIAPPHHCINCTGLVWGTMCMECNHFITEDSELFNTAVHPDAQPPLSASIAQCVLAYDERMMLHCEEDKETDEGDRYDDEGNIGGGFSSGGGNSSSRSTPHPERPDRIRSVMARLESEALAGVCRRLPVRAATRAELLACHTPNLIDAVEMLARTAAIKQQQQESLRYQQPHFAAAAADDAAAATLVPQQALPPPATVAAPSINISPDTYVNPHTALCAALSAGACVDVAVQVATGTAKAGIAVVRPPGHHAESNTAMGFCFYNNAGVAARAAQQVPGIKRVMILDWDIHHGNGTQHIFEDDPTVLYASLHRHDGGTFYPGTGGAHKVGTGKGTGYSVNVPWPCGGIQNGDYIAAFHHIILPVAYDFSPDLIIISAGFDAAEGDPIGGCNLTPEVFAHMTAMLQMIAPTCALLEGGYNLLATAVCTEACVRVLLGERPPRLPVGGEDGDGQQQSGPTTGGLRGIVAAAQALSTYWECLAGLELRLPAPPPPPPVRLSLAALSPAGTGTGGVTVGLPPHLQHQQQQHHEEDDNDEEDEEQYMDADDELMDYASSSGEEENEENEGEEEEEEEEQHDGGYDNYEDDENAPMITGTTNTTASADDDGGDEKLKIKLDLSLTLNNNINDTGNDGGGSASPKGVLKSHSSDNDVDEEEDKHPGSPVAAVGGGGGGGGGGVLDAVASPVLLPLMKGDVYVEEEHLIIHHHHQQQQQQRQQRQDGA